MLLKKYAISAMALAILMGNSSVSLATGLNEDLIQDVIRATKPTIKVTDKTIKVGDNFNPLKGVTAKDIDGSNLTKHVIVTYNKVDTKKAGVYKVGYAVLGKKGQRTDVEIKVTVVGKETVISSSDMYLTVGTDLNTINFKEGVNAIDVTGLNITQHLVVTNNNVNTSKAGKYTVKYVVLDTKGNRIYHTRNIIVKEGSSIKAEDKVINKGDKFNPLENITAVDITGKDLTRYIIVTKNTVDTNKGGIGQVTYVVLDTLGNRITKTINVKVVGKTEIIAEDMEISTGNHDFNPLNYIEAVDVSGLDITKHVLVIKNTVNTYKAGEYEVVFRVLDTEGRIIDKTIKVTVVGKDIATDEEIADILIKKIDSLDSEVLYTQYSEIKAIREEYNKASNSVKDLVTNINKLIEVEEKLQVKIDKVMNVNKLISELPTEITLDVEAQIKEARNAYDALTEDEKKGILDIQLNILIQSEQILDKLIIIRDNVNVKESIEAIEKIPAIEEITLNDNEVIKQARVKYDALPEELKFVVNVYTLEKAEKKLFSLMPEKVQSLIVGLGYFPAIEDITSQNVEGINDFMKAYNKLTSEEKALVGNEEKINALNSIAQNIKKAQSVIEIIKALPEVNVIKIADKTKVEKAREAYVLLPEGAGKYVSNYEKLVELEKKVAQLEAKVDEVKGMLTSLPSPEKVTIEHLDAINEFSTAYNKLTSEQKKLVAPDEMVVIEYEFICDRIEKAQLVVEMIKSLPEVDNIRKEDKTKVEEARNAYTQLDKGADKYVTNYDKLVKLEEKLSTLS